MNVIEVVDVPMGTSESAARELLNRPCAENRYMLVHVLLLPDGTTRAFYRLLAKSFDADLAGRESVKAGDDAAKAIVAANVTSTAPKIQELLADQGIVRGLTWVKAARAKLSDTVDAMTPAMSPAAVCAATGLSRAGVTRMRAELREQVTAGQRVIPDTRFKAKRVTHE